MKQKNKPFRSAFFLFLAIVVLMTTYTPAFAAEQLSGHRNGLDDAMSKQVSDSYLTSQLPFEKVWELNLGGSVENQPIIIDSMRSIFVQAGKNFLRINYDQASKTNPPKVDAILDITNHSMASGSSPTYAMTKYGPRIYQATRDHFLVAIDPLTMRPLWRSQVSAGGKPDMLYRIQSSPLVKEIDGKTVISIGTATGDLSGKTKDYYADNGFIVYEDMGSSAKLIGTPERMRGEVTGSHLLNDGKIIGTENTNTQKSNILIWDPETKKVGANSYFQFDSGVPTSMAQDVSDGAFYAVDRSGVLYKVNKNLQRVWQNDKDETGQLLKNSYALESPTIGDKYIYKGVRNYKNIQTGGPGAIVVHRKDDGKIVKVIPLSSPLKNHILYWKPYKDKPGYITVYESNGKLQFIEEDTWKPVAWFKDSDGVLKYSPNLPNTDANHISPQIIFHDNLLLVIDGTGRMHAFKAQRPKDLAVKSFEIMNGKIEDLKIGDPVRLRGVIQNTSEENFKSVLVTFTQLENDKPVVIERRMDLPRLGETEIIFDTVVTDDLPQFELWVNPKFDNPKDEINRENNMKQIVVPLDLRIDEFKLDKTFISKEDMKVTATIKTFVKNIRGQAPAKKVKTYIEVVADGVKFRKDVQLSIGVAETHTMELDLSSISLQGKNAVIVTAGVNPQFTIYEYNPDLTEKEYKANNFTRADLPAAKPGILIVKTDSDLVAESLTVKNPVTTGDKVTVKGVVRNDSTKAANNVLVRFLVDGSNIYEARTTLLAGQSKEVSFVWTAGAAGPVNFRMIVDPLHEQEDSNRLNNVKDAATNVLPQSAPPNSCSATNPTGKWTVTYWVITGYPTKTGSYTYVDEEGKEQRVTYTYTDYADPIWAPRQVTYNEKLEGTLAVNTKQAIPTDPKNPKPEDRESRGSWEIIPYAAKNGLNANEVTRAGYGFEVNVSTDYWNDWETKIPSGLAGTPSAFGGTYSGPTEVQVEIYDVAGKLALRTNLEKTSGDNKTATWELPMQTHTVMTGEKVTDRKFYTDVDSKDGDYTVRITAKFAGVNGLSICQTKTVRIYGSMYDDVQNTRK